MNLDPKARLEGFVKEVRDEMDKRIDEKIKERNNYHMIKHSIAGGKRLRPALLILTYKALGGYDIDKVFDVAVALELAHNASLIHDDIIDWDYYRRSAPSLWRKAGIGRALIQGHRMINLAFRTVLEKGVELAEIMLRAWDSASSGVIEEILASESFSKNLYIKVAKEKTASLFAAAAEGAAVLAGASHELRQLLKEYGENIGIAYQMADDLVEISKRGFSVGMPILILRQIEEAVRSFFFSVKKGKIVWLIKSIPFRLEMGKFLNDEINIYLEKAKELASSDLIPEGVYKEMMKEFPRFCVSSMLSEARSKVRG